MYVWLNFFEWSLYDCSIFCGSYGVVAVSISVYDGGLLCFKLKEKLTQQS